MKKSYGQRLRETLDGRITRQEQFSYLKQAIEDAKQEASRASSRAVFAAQDAERHAFEKYARMHQELSCVFERIGIEMGRRLGDELRPHAEKMASGMSLKLSSHFDYEMQCEVIRAEIPALRFSYILNPSKWR